MINSSTWQGFGGRHDDSSTKIPRGSDLAGALPKQYGHGMVYLQSFEFQFISIHQLQWKNRDQIIVIAILRRDS